MKKVKKLGAFTLCIVILLNMLPVFAFAAADRDLTFENSLAVRLKGLGLFNGVSDTDFDLNRAPTRTEAMVILVRVLGKEKEALGGTWTHPFTDVESWADKYIGYAYSNGLTNGVSQTEYGTGTAGADMFLTLMLRALGYSDKNNADFSWDNPSVLAKSVGILPDAVHTDPFLRADTVIISYAALSVKLKGSGQTLAQKLTAAGAFTQVQFTNCYDAGAISKHQTSAVLSAKEIYAKCAPAVFFLEVYDANGKATASGSGFFIDAGGMAVTNYHVIDGASSAKITVSDTGKTYNVLGVYAWSETEDWALLKIDGKGFSYLKMGDSGAVKGGETVYAIGSPLGLQNTISEGLISNPSRTESGINYVQISAAISPGSSGGALINEYGQVVGITSASYKNGQNLNLALPISYVKVPADTTTCKTLSSVTIKPITDPMAKLKAYLMKYGEYDSKYKYYTIQTAFKETTYYISYSVDYNDFVFASAYEPETESMAGKTVHTMMYITDLSGRNHYACLIPELSIEATGYLSAKTFCSTTTLTLSTYKGLAADKTTMGKICALSLCNILSAVEYMFIDNEIGLSIRDFGFEARYQEIHKAA